jgi:hypothetical protein
MQLDGYVSSAKKVHAAILILALSVAYFSSVEYQRRNFVDFLSGIDLSLGLYKAALSLNDLGRPLKGRDLTKFFREAQNDHFALQHTKWEFQFDGAESEVIYYLEKQQSRYGDQSIPAAYVVENVTTRMDPGVPCEFAFFQASGREKASLLDHTVREDVNFIPSNDIYLVVPSMHCRRVLGRDSAAFMFRSDRDDAFWIFALPAEEVSELGIIQFTLIEGIRTFEYRPPKWIGHLPPHVRDMIYHGGDYTHFQVEDLKRLIFQQAQLSSGKIYSPDQFFAAVDDLFQKSTAEANLFGWSSPGLMDTFWLS